MLFRQRTAGVKYTRKMKPALILGTLLIAITAALTACAAPKGGIVILENPNGMEFTMDFKEWSAKNKCELSLEKGDELQVEIARDGGEIALAVSGKNGSEPYTGNDLRSGIFTVTVSETDEYAITITGKDATGKVTLKNLAGQ
ncbi:MAG TPA: hypothetical protein PKW29_10795 [Clostridia bacterium]|nr:hypothetical protein [Clostridia bacterium]